MSGLAAAFLTRRATHVLQSSTRPSSNRDAAFLTEGMAWRVEYGGLQENIAYKRQAVLQQYWMVIDTASTIAQKTENLNVNVITTYPIHHRSSVHHKYSPTASEIAKVRPFTVPFIPLRREGQYLSPHKMRLQAPVRAQN